MSCAFYQSVVKVFGWIKWVYGQDVLMGELRGGLDEACRSEVRVDKAMGRLWSFSR